MTIAGKERLRPFVSHHLPDVDGILSRSSRGELETAIDRLHQGAPVFARLDLEERISLIDDIREGIVRNAGAAAAAGCRAKGIAAGSALEGEEWATGTVITLRHLRLVRETLQRLRDGREQAGHFGRRRDGRTTARIFPGHPIDGVLFRGVTVDVHFREGLEESDVREGAAPFYRHAPHGGRTVLVLGGGNIAAIPVADIITKLFNEGKVCLLKMNPVNSYLGPYVEDAFAEAVKRGFLAVVYGGAEEGGYLCRHDGIDEIHITGSDKTYDTILWGPERIRGGDRSGKPLIDKPVTAELGNIAPVIVVPGPYGTGEMRYQAEDIAGYATINASFLCNAAKVLVFPRRWRGRDAFMGHFEEAMARIPTRYSYYPGAREGWESLTAGRAELRTFGRASADRLPWALLPPLDPESSEERLFEEEVFTNVIGEVQVGSPDPVDFLIQAVEFANRRLWGTLSATIVVHPSLMKDPVTEAAVEEAVSSLKYGSVAINAFPGLSYAFSSPPWGAFPGTTPEDIQSGRGWVHNTSMLEGVEKCVLRHPLQTFPRPPYHPGRRSLLRLMRRVSDLETDYSWRKVPAVVMAAMKG